MDEMTLRKEIGKSLVMAMEEAPNIRKQLQEKYGITIPYKTMWYYKRNGPSPEALRFLLLLHHLGITVGSLIESRSRPRNASKTINELTSHREFVALCELLATFHPSTRASFIGALVKSLRSLKISILGTSKSSLEV